MLFVSLSPSATDIHGNTVVSHYHWKVMLITEMKATIMSRWICDGDRV